MKKTVVSRTISTVILILISLVLILSSCANDTSEALSDSSTEARQNGNEAKDTDKNAVPDTPNQNGTDTENGGGEATTPSEDEGNDDESIDIPSSAELEYTINADGKSYFVSGIGQCADTDIVIPKEHEGLPVTGIANGAFANKTNITTVIIQAGVTSIGASAFEGCSSLTNVLLPSTLESIGDNAFKNCLLIVKLLIPSNITSVGASIFDGCSALVSIFIKDENVPLWLKDMISEAVNVTTAHKHTLESIAEKKPTCTERGHNAYKECDECGYTTVSYINALGHTSVNDTAKDPTCTETGLTAGTHCSVCKEVLIAQTVVPAKGHKRVTDAAKAATCTETGLTEGAHCPVCEEVLTAQTVVPAKGHKPVTDAAKAATCTETGLTEGAHCSVCEEVLTAQTVVPAKGHTTVTIEGKDATCKLPGLTDGAHCSVCGEVQTEQQVIPAGHSSENGICKKCGIKVDTWDGSIDTSWYNATDNSFIINTAEQLAGLASLSNSGNNFKNKTITLGTNIDLSGLEWTPISSESSFEGTFNGMGYVVSNFKITSKSMQYVGLFGRSAGTILCLGVENFTIDTEYSNGSAYVGGLVGSAGGMIVNCYATGNVSAYAYSYNTANAYVGGLIGGSSAQVVNCYATGNVYAGSGSRSYSAYSYAGGLIGDGGWGKITNCFATGNVSVRAGLLSYCYAGGLVGTTYNNPVNSYVLSTQEFSSTMGTVTPNTYGVAVSAEQLCSKEWCSENIFTFEIDIWDFSDGYPVLSPENIASTVIEISTADALKALQGQTLVCKYKLTADIDLKGISWTPIHAILGSFDGNGHTVSNLTIKGSDHSYVGLIGKNYGAVSGLTLENVQISTDNDSTVNIGALIASNYGTVNGCHANVSINAKRNDAYVGGLIGYNYGTVYACSTEGSVYFQNTYSGGTVYCGGLIGYNYGEVSCCYSTANVTATGSAGSSSSTRIAYAGGLIGYSAKGTVTDCYATGNASATISESYNFAYAGGLIGYASSTVISNCYATGNATATVSTSSKSHSRAGVGGLTGYESSCTVTNCYTNDAQKFSVTARTPSTSSAGTKTPLSTILTAAFHTEALGWSSGVWSFADGEHPTLK